MKLIVTTLFALLLSPPHAGAVGPAMLDNLVAFSGQGAPRATGADCVKSGEAITRKLAAFAFEQLTVTCVGTSEDIGGFVPAIKGRAPKAFSTEQAVGSRASSADDCATALAALTAPLDPRSVLEAECLQGSELTNNQTRAYFQPWVTKLIAHEGRIPQSARKKSRGAHRTSSKIKSAN